MAGKLKWYQFIKRWKQEKCEYNNAVLRLDEAIYNASVLKMERKFFRYRMAILKTKCLPQRTRRKPAFKRIGGKPATLKRRRQRQAKDLPRQLVGLQNQILRLEEMVSRYGR